MTLFHDCALYFGEVFMFACGRQLVSPAHHVGELLLVRHRRLLSAPPYASAFDGGIVRRRDDNLKNGIVHNRVDGRWISLVTLRRTIVIRPSARWNVVNPLGVRWP